ncbi:hypothetical protein E1B28_011082 [Marasmius oreades]|uniref:DUF6729 domain-containing protein n=1 Tax=Marasmius oreades TaxID=181124 RepID=A0A9P7RTC2_9AGAR|nr:uncharacterized protein E1B28_011082 [Marasmius oreades]KAG7089394.1 hypothetical protein E1B28_011082 [Marasmius oreades]
MPIDSHSSNSLPQTKQTTISKNRGGTRPGAGRKKKNPTSTLISVPSQQPNHSTSTTRPAAIFNARVSSIPVPSTSLPAARSSESMEVQADQHTSQDPVLLSHANWEQLAANIDYVVGNDENADIAGRDTVVEDSMFGAEDDVSMEESAQIAEREAEASQAKAYSAMGIYLEQVLNNVRQEIQKHNMPRCYQHGDFWIRPRHPIFSLQHGAIKTEFTPTLLYQKDVFVWLPSFLPGAPDRFICSCGRYLSRHGYNENPIARRVSSAPTDYYLLTNRYFCDWRRRDTTSEGCGQTYQGTDPLIIGQLPRHVQEAFPCYLSHRGAVDKDVMNELRCTIATRFGPEPFARMQQELQTIYHSRLELMYLAAAQQYGKRDVQPFSSFNDPLGYNGASHSTHYFKSMFTEWYAAHRIYLDRVQASLPLTIAKADHTFKVMIHMAKIKGEPMHRALYTIVNEWEQVRGRAACLTKSLSYVDEHWTSIEQGLREHGHPTTEFVWTDAPKVEQAYHESITKSLRKNVQHPEIDKWRNLLTFQSSVLVPPFLCDSYDSIDIACDNVLTSLEPASLDKLILVLDSKSETELVGVGGPEGVPRVRGSRIDLLQVRVGSQSYIFRLTQLTA